MRNIFIPFIKSYCLTVLLELFGYSDIFSLIQSKKFLSWNQLPHLLPVDLVWELVIVVIAHHQQVALQLLLLGRVELTLLVTAAALVLLTVTVVLKILLLLRLLVEVSLRLVCVLVHLLPLRSPLRIELSGVKFNPRDSRIRLTRLV